MIRPDRLLRRAWADRPSLASGLESLPPVGSTARTYVSRGASTIREDRRLALALVGVFGLVVGVRLLPFPEVFRGGDIVLTGNDPYRQRYWVETLAARSTGVLDLGIVAGLPDPVATTQPLMILTLWWLTELLGGGETAAGLVLATYPVVSALVTAAVVYLLGARVGEDPRVGLAAVGLLAVAPGHAFRTGLGFADHHAFDYPWLVLGLYALLILIESDPRERRTWATAGLLGVAVAGQTLAWQAGPILLAPLGLSLAAYALLAVRDGIEGVEPLVPAVAGLAFAAVLVGGVRATLGWPVGAVAYAPALLALGGAGVLGSAAVIARVGRSAPTLGVLQATGAAGGAYLLWRAGPAIAPEVTASLLGYVRRGISYFQGFEGSGIGEVQPLTASFGPIAGPLIMLGYAAFLGLPVVAWAVWRAYDGNEAPALLVSVYVAYFTGWSLLQRRFTGELAPVLCVLAGFGFVALLGWLELARPPGILRSRPDAGPAAPGSGTGGEPTSRGPPGGGDAAGAEPAIELPGRRRLAVFGTLSFLIVSFPTLFTAFINRDLAFDDDKYRAATWMREYADDRGWEYPRNYVFSAWGRNQPFNYLVNGQSRSYWFAREHYEAFLRSDATETAEWYERLRGRVGFVVTDEEAARSALFSSSVYTTLQENVGSEDLGRAGVAHYRAVYASRDGGLKVFTLVPGATITGTGPAEATVSVSTEVSIPGTEFRYRREVRTNADGSFSVTVPYPGEYAVGEVDVAVSDDAVRSGGTVQVDGLGGE